MKKNIVILLYFALFQNCKGRIEKQKEIYPIQKKSNNSSTRLNYRDIDSYCSLENIICELKESRNGFYKLNCDNHNFRISNSIIKSDEKNQIEFISIKFNDIDNTIIRNINISDLISSKPYIYYNKNNNSYVFLFPLIGEYNFGWFVYYYKDNKFYFLGRRITYWKPEFEETKTSYKDFTKIYQNKSSLFIEMPAKIIIGEDKEYQSYPNDLDGELTLKGENYLFEFKLNDLKSYKLYNDGCYEGDYNKMIYDNVIKPIN